MTDTSTSEKAQNTASTAADEGKHVAGVAQEEAGKVASEAAAQARSVVDEATTQMRDQGRDQARQQRDNVVSTLGSFSKDLSEMADRADDGNVAAGVAREVAQRAQGLTSYLDGREPAELLDDVRDFARRRPGTFLLGALAAGVVAGRLTRGVKDAGSPSTTGQASTGAPATPATQPTPPMPATTGMATGSPTAVPPTPPSPTYPPQQAGLGTDAAGYGRGDDIPGRPA